MFGDPDDDLVSGIDAIILLHGVEVMCRHTHRNMCYLRIGTWIRLFSKILKTDQSAGLWISIRVGVLQAVERGPQECRCAKNT